MYNFLKESERWSKEKLRKYQEKQLQKFLEQTVKHVPFYSKINISSEDPFKNLEKFPIVQKETIHGDLEKFPVMEKEIMQRDINKFLADNIPKKNTYYVTTGGTTNRTGSYFGFNLDNSAYGKEWAFVMMAWRRVGFKPGDKMVSFRGIECKKTDKGIFWQDNPIYNMIEMSPFHMSEENLPKYIKKIKECKLKYLYGYPSLLSLLAKYVENCNNGFPKIKAVLAVSEDVYPGQRELIERAFNTRLFSFYGLSEKVIMAPECEYDTRYHAFPEYGITEVVDKNGDPVGEGERGELVGTGFLNHYLPFIRYRTVDFATLSDQKCKCGRNHIMLEDLKGRSSQDFLVGKSEVLYSMTSIYFIVHSDIFDNVYRFQFSQKDPGFVTLKIIPRIGFSSDDKKKIFDAIYERTGKDLELFIEEVDNIELTPGGKSKLFIQDLDTEKWM